MMPRRESRVRARLCPLTRDFSSLHTSNVCKHPRSPAFATRSIYASEPVFSRIPHALRNDFFSALYIPTSHNRNSRDSYFSLRTFFFFSAGNLFLSLFLVKFLATITSTERGKTFAHSSMFARVRESWEKEWARNSETAKTNI